MGRRDLAFWQAFACEREGLVLELGCGTGRVTQPLARAGVAVVGVDRSVDMLARAHQRLRRVSVDAARRLIRADITALPFATGAFAAVIAPYGVLQSLLSDRALSRTLTSVAAALEPGGRFGLELVPDVPRWKETRRRVSLVGLTGPHGKPVTLIESVRQDRLRHITTFEHEFLEGRGRERHSLQFTIRFRTLHVPAMIRRLQRAGFAVDGAFGGYRGESWSERALTWIITARKPLPL
jgi:SAM-dependent methyltransferase